MKSLAQQFEVSRAGSGSHVRPMEGLRGLAIFLVFLVHYVTLMEPWVVPQSSLQAFAHALHTIGNTGVDLFFVLSGYLIYGSLISRPQRFTSFMQRRMERIYPTFTVVFFIYVVLSFALPGRAKIPASAPAALLYLVENFLLLPGLFPIQPMITVAWSLSYEMFYYIVIPVLISLLNLRDRTALFRVLFFGGISAVFSLYCAIYTGPIRLIMFVSGIFLFEALARQKIVPLKSTTACAAFTLGMCATLVPTIGSGGYVLKICVLFVTFMLMCHTCFGRPTGWLARFFSWLPLRWLGNMSYSYYLVHGLALKAGTLVLAKLVTLEGRGLLFFCAVMFVMFVLTWIVSAILFLTIERPFSLSSGRRVRPAPPVGSCIP